MGAKNLYEIWQLTKRTNDFEDLLSFKKKQKKNWDTLGLSKFQQHTVTAQQKKLKEFAGTFLS